MPLLDIFEKEEPTVIEKMDVIRGVHGRVIEQNTELLKCLNELNIGVPNDKEVVHQYNAVIELGSVDNGLLAAGYKEDSDEFYDMKNIIVGLIGEAVKKLL